MSFGVTYSVCTLFLRFGIRILLRVLASDGFVQGAMPSTQEIRKVKGTFSAKYHTLKDVYDVADGLELVLEQCGHFVIENMFYHG